MNAGAQGQPGPPGMTGPAGSIGAPGPQGNLGENNYVVDRNSILTVRLNT